MATAEEVMAHIEQGRDPELDKLITKRSDELGISRMEALRRLLARASACLRACAGGSARGYTQATG